MSLLSVLDSSPDGITDLRYPTDEKVRVSDGISVVQITEMGVVR